MPTTAGTPWGRVGRLLVVALFVGALVGALWLHDVKQRDQIERSLRATESGQSILDSVVAMENATRDFTFAHDAAALARFDDAQRLEQQAVVSARATVHRDAASKAALHGDLAAVAAWHAIARSDIDRARLGDPALNPATAASDRDLVLDHVRAANASFQQAVAAAGVAERDRISTFGTIAVLAMGVAFAAISYLCFIRVEQREARFRARQERFAEELQQVAAPEHAGRVVARHIRRSLRAATVTVKLAGEHDELPIVDDDVVGVEASDGKVRTRRLVVGGRAIGVVRVTSERRLRVRERTCIDDSALRAAPVLANVRLLAIAQSQAATDALTGLGNRRLVEDALRRLVAQSARTGESFAVVMIDVDRFKSVNDHFGHQRGDDVLVGIARALQRSTRPYDIVGRRGGDEFIMLLSRVDVDGARAVAERCRRAVCELQITGDQPVTASFGLTVADGLHIETNAVLGVADAALYRAKADGGNAVVVGHDDARFDVSAPLAAER